MNEFKQISTELLDFIKHSPTCYHAVAELAKMLTEAGYKKLEEKEKWELQPEGRYFVVRNDSSLIAFSLPADGVNAKGFHIVASHSDSPCFKVKECPEKPAEKVYVMLNTEKYGGMILSSWMDRPLSVAGRLAVKTESGVETKLVNADRDLLVIPNLAIHMNRDVNNGTALKAQTDMLPLFSMQEEGKESSLIGFLAKEAGIDPDAVLGHDLFVYARSGGSVLGAEEEFILSPRLDDLQCAFSSVKAMCDANPKAFVNVCAVFDNEEVGSGTRQGADSTFLEDVLHRICDGIAGDAESFYRMVAESFLLSADNAHAAHPAHGEKADPTNRPVLNGGVVIKYHGSQKYATDGISGAMVKDWCNRAGVPFQTYANHSDIVGGSTLGNISMSHISLAGADIGLPQFAMHSAMETAGVKDTKYAVDLMKQFYRE